MALGYRHDYRGSSTKCYDCLQNPRFPLPEIWHNFRPKFNGQKVPEGSRRFMCTSAPHTNNRRKKLFPNSSYMLAVNKLRLPVVVKFE